MWRNGKRFPCPDCHKTFATQVDLKAHLMRHITQHPYVCFACGKGFKYDHTLDFHIKSQHGAENEASSGSAGGSGSVSSITGSGKNESFNLKSLNRKSCKVKREVFEEKAGLFGASGVSGSGRRSTPQIQGGISSPDDSIVNNNNNVPINSNHSTVSTSGMANSCDNRCVNGEISTDLRHHLTNPLQLAGLNLSSGPGGLGILEPSILNGLKFPIALSSYPSASSSNSSQSSSSKSNNTLPIVPPPKLPSSTVSSSSTLISASLASSSLTSSLLTTTPPSSLVTSLTLSSSTTPTPSISKEKLMNPSQMPLIDFGLQGDVLSPRNLQIKSEKVLISILEGVHPLNEQLYSLYKCCLCGFAFPSLEPVSIHIQSMHSNNLNLTCDKCGATFKWKSELQLHEQLHKVMDQSINNINTSSNKCKSQLKLPQYPHHSHSNQQLQRGDHHHLLQHQQQSRSLVMPSFLQPNLVFMNPYLSGDQQLISKESEETKRAKVKMEPEEETSGKDDGQGLNLCLKRKHKSEIRDTNNKNNINHDSHHNDSTIKHNGINYDNENNINNCNAHDNNNDNGHDGISSMMMDEPIDLKVESSFADSNNNINDISPINPLSFLHSSLLPSSVGLPFPAASASQLTSAAAAAAAAFAAGISSQHQPQHSKNKQLHQHFQSIASMVSGISTMTTTTSGTTSTMSSGLGPGSASGSGSASSSSSSGSVTGNGSGFGSVTMGSAGEGIGKIREPIGDIEETAPGQFKCRYCEKTFDRIFSVHRHERVHTGYKPCICRVCGRGFSEKRNLRHHIIRFHSDGSGRELLKRVRKEKSISAASFLKKAAVRLLSNSSLEGSAMEEEDVNKRPSDKNNNILKSENEVSEAREDEQFDREPRFGENEDTSANTTKVRNKESCSNNSDCNDKEIGSDVNGESNVEDGGKMCATFSSSSSSSSSRRRKSKPSKKITNLESGDKSDDECELSGNGDQPERKDESVEGMNKKHEDDDGDEDEDGEGEGEGGEEEEEEENRVGSMAAEYYDHGEDSNEQHVDMNSSSMMKKDAGTEDGRERDCGDSANDRSSNNDLNGSLDENKCSQEGKSRLHGAFFSNYSPRLALVDKVLKRSKQSKPMIGPDGRYLYPCDHCQKTFCSSSDLNRHIGFHESKDIRPFKCEFCDYQSRTNSQLKVHVMRHAGIKQYLCHTCNYNGVTQSDLNRHRKTQSHKSRSGNICAICSLGFSTPTLLEDHLFKFHDNGNNDKRGSSASPQESKLGPLSPPSSSSPPSATCSLLPKDGPSAFSLSPITTSPPPPPPPLFPPSKTDRVDEEMDNNNNIDVNHNNVLGLNANKFSVNNLL